MRAVTVPVSAKTGVAGFVFPGDHVDLVLTQTVTGDETQPLKAAETILRNVRVLATDQSTETVTNEEGKTEVREFRTVTLEVTPKMAEKIAVAQTIGTLSLALRSLADNEAELEKAIAAGDVKIPDNASAEEEERILRTAMSRPIDRGSTYSTGGDVSRFQRRTMPKMNSRNVGSANAAARGDVTSSYKGPLVRVTRGKETTAVPVNRGTGALLDRQSNGMRDAGRTVPVASSALIR